MSDDVIDRDEAIFRRRLAGKSIRAIAREFRCEPAEVSEIVERMCTPVSPAMRRQVLALDLERLDELMATFYEEARTGDASAAVIVLKVSERRASLLGLDVPASVRGDNIQLPAAAKEPSSLDRIRAAIDLVTSQCAAPVLVTGNGSGSTPPVGCDEPE
jgi:hypothetical protein